ncbi:MAG: hypothetical protein L0220_05810 [Acidobacteria bacterium]|nr:hypothetical protein [Acidobacteriota bacterium]
MKIWQAESDARWQQLDLNAQQLDDRNQKWKAESEAAIDRNLQSISEL